MKTKLNSDFKCITKQKLISKKDMIKIFKNEFNNCIEDKTLDANITYSINNPIAKFEFIKKEK